MSKRSLPDGDSESAKKRRICAFRHEYSMIGSCLVKTSRTDYARCTICNSEFSIGHQGKSDCQRHIQSQKHSKLAVAAKNNTTLSAFMSPGNNSLDDAVTRAEVLFTRFLLEHNIPVSASDHVSKLFRAMFLGSEHNASEIIKKYSCARTKTTCIINKLAELESSELAQAMASGPYSLATDASNDKNEKLFPIVIRMEYRGVIRTELLSIVELVGKGTGENISKLILDELRGKNIPIGNCMALTTDNANVMIGERNGLYGFLLKENSSIFSTGCVCHRIHLAAEWAAKELSKNVSSFFIDIYYYMDKSANRVNSFHEFQDSCGTPGTAVKKHCPTRWLSLAETCSWVLEQWEPLREFFKAECEDDARPNSQCKKVLENLNSRMMRLLIMFLNYVLPTFNKANLILQREEAQIHRQHRLMLRLLKDLQVMFVKPSALANKMSSDVDFTSQYNILPDNALMVGQNCREFMDNKQFSAERRGEFYTCAKNFLKTATTYLKKNLPLDSEVIQNAQVADISQRETATFSSIMFFIKRFENISQSDPDQLEREFRQYQSHEFSNFLDDSVSVSDQWQELANFKDEFGDIPFANLAKLMLRILSIPHSNASCERVFSLVRKNRTDFRANMSLSTLQNILILKQAGGVCYESQPDRETLRACKLATKDSLKKD